MVKGWHVDDMLGECVKDIVKGIQHQVTDCPTSIFAGTGLTFDLYTFLHKYFSF